MILAAVSFRLEFWGHFFRPVNSGRHRECWLWFQKRWNSSNASTSTTKVDPPITVLHIASFLLFWCALAYICSWCCVAVAAAPASDKQWSQVEALKSSSWFSSRVSKLPDKDLVVWPCLQTRRQDYPPLETSSHAVAWVSLDVWLGWIAMSLLDALQCAYARRTKIRPPSDWRRPPGRPRQTWLHQIGDGSAAFIRQEWDLAVRCGHSRRMRSVLCGPPPSKRSDDALDKIVNGLG